MCVLDRHVPGIISSLSNANPRPWHKWTVSENFIPLSKPYPSKNHRNLEMISIWNSPLKTSFDFWILPILPLLGITNDPPPPQKWVWILSGNEFIMQRLWFMPYLIASLPWFEIWFKHHQIGKLKNTSTVCSIFWTKLSIIKIQLARILSNIYTHQKHHQLLQK